MCVKLHGVSLEITHKFNS